MIMQGEKREKKINKMAAKAESKAIGWTNENNILIMYNEKHIIVNHFFLFYNGCISARWGEQQFCTDNSIIEKDSAIAFYTSESCLIFQSDDSISYVDSKKSVASNEQFALLLCTTEFVELIVVNGVYGNQLLRFARNLSEVKRLIQIFRMSVVSMDAEKSKLLGNFLLTLNGVI